MDLIYKTRIMDILLLNCFTVYVEMNVIGTIEESHGMCLNVVRPGGHLETHCKSAGPIEVKEGDGTLYKCFMKQTGGQCQ